MDDETLKTTLRPQQQPNTAPSSLSVKLFRLHLSCLYIRIGMSPSQNCIVLRSMALWQSPFISCHCASRSLGVLQIGQWSHTNMLEAAADEEDVYLTAQSNSLSSSSRSSYLSAVDCGFCPFCRSERLDEKRLTDGIIIITCLDCGCSSVPSSAVDQQPNAPEPSNCDTNQLVDSSIKVSQLFTLPNLITF